MLNIVAIPAFSDNYIWCIFDAQSKKAIVVDPGSSKDVQDFLSTENLSLEAILITHHHPDHIGGVNQLKQTYPANVYGFGQSNLPFIDHPLSDGDEFSLLGCTFTTIEVPGHTLDHIAFYSHGNNDFHVKPWLFCGDTLFSGGCGRLFEGTAKQMHNSLLRLSQYPAETEIYCAHEYTLSNLEFARSLMPNNMDLKNYQTHCHQLRNQLKPTIPTTIDTELKINPFLRVADNEIIHELNLSKKDTDIHEFKKHPELVFAAVRRAKDTF